MKALLFRWVVSALGLILVSQIFTGIQVDGLGWAFIAAIFLGFFNALIRPLVIILTLPLNILTLGLFTLVINGLMLWLTGKLLAGFTVHGFWAAVGGALVLSLINWGASSILGERSDMQIIEMRRDYRDRRDYWS